MAVQSTRIMAALVILDAVRQDLLPGMGSAAPDIVWDPTVALMQRLEAGEEADGLFAIDGAMQALVSQGSLRAETMVPIVQAQFAIAAPQGLAVAAPRNGDELIDLLRNTPSIAVSRAGASGIYFEQLIDRLGIGDDVRPKMQVIRAGLTGELIRSGQAVLAFQQLSELMAVPGIQVLGPLPDDCQQVTDFSAAIFTNARNPQGAQDFIDLLRSDLAARSFTARGLKLRY